MLRNLTSEGWRWARHHSPLLAAAAILLIAIGALPAMTSTAKAADSGTIAVCAFDSGGNPIVLGADQAWYQPQPNGSTNYVGAVGDSGCREQTLPGGTSVGTWVAKDGVYSNHQTTTVVAGQTVTVNFYTTNVTLEYSHSIAFGGAYGDSGWFKQTPATASMELFSDGVTPVHFRLDGTGGASGRLALTWPAATGTGATYTASLIAARVIDSTGAPIVGATARYQAYYWYYAPGSSDANGILAFAIPGLQTDVTVEMNVNNTIQQIQQDPSVNSIYQFQTSALTVKYSGGLAYGGPVGSEYYFVPDPMQVLPGTINFQFRSPQGNCTEPITVAAGGLNITKSAILASLKDSANHGLAGGAATAYVGGWQPVGTTDSSGVACALFNGTLGNTSVAMVYNGTRQQITQNQPTNSIYAFQTSLVNVMVQGHDNNSLDIPNNGSASYYAGGWHAITTVNANNHDLVQAQMLPGSYSFAATYNGTRDQKSVTVTSSATTVYFHAALVTVTLQDHAGGTLTADTASYYAGSWHTMVNAQAEMLPGSYSFAATYNGTRGQKTYTVIEPNPNNNANATQSVVFQTGQVHSASNTATAYYAGGWHTFTNGAELLPGTYTFSFSDNTPNTLEGVVAGVVNNIH